MKGGEEACSKTRAGEAFSGVSADFSAASGTGGGGGAARAASCSRGGDVTVTGTARLAAVTRTFACRSYALLHAARSSRSTLLFGSSKSAFS